MYYVVYGFCYLVSLLPFWFLYGISYLAYVLIYHVIGYRKHVVLSNLAIAFPEKTDAERKLIAKQFYKNFTDSFAEVLKLFSMSPAQLHKRFSWDHESLNKYHATGRNVQAHLGHFFNWEYANLSLSLQSVYKVLVVYMPIASKALDRVFIRLRTRFDAKMIGATSFLKDFKPYSKERTCLIFVADQNAGRYNLAYWLPFFGKLAPFVTGPEKTARLNNSICVYANFKKIKRGHYHVSIDEITTAPRLLKEGDLTKKIRDMVEENIRAQPENYLWTHRRWKRRFDPEKHRAL